MRRILLSLCGLGLLCWSGLASADHAGHGASAHSASASYNPFIQGGGRLQSRLGYSFSWSHLDNGAGQVYLQQLEGELPVLETLSLTARVPLVSLQLNFRPDQTAIGDVAFGAKDLLMAGENNSLIFGAELSFPTGNRTDGTGAGAIIASPYFSYQLDLELVHVYAGLGASFEVDNNPEPTLAPSVGLAVPLIREGVPFSAFVTVRSDVVLADETFTAGSAKIYAEPGFILYTSDERHLSFSVLGTFSIGDTLSVKNGLALAADSLALTQDSFVGASFQVNYTF